MQADDCRLRHGPTKIDKARIVSAVKQFSSAQYAAPRQAEQAVAAADITRKESDGFCVGETGNGLGGAATVFTKIPGNPGRTVAHEPVEASAGHLGLGYELALIVKVVRGKPLCIFGK